MDQIDLGYLCTSFVRNQSFFPPLSLPLPTNVLGQNLFESIKNEPFSIPEDDGNDLTHTFFNPNREGWLLKLGKGEDFPSSSDLPVCMPPTTNLPREPTIISAVLCSCLLPWAEADTCC